MSLWTQLFDSGLPWTPAPSKVIFRISKELKLGPVPRSEFEAPQGAAWPKRTARTKLKAGAAAALCQVKDLDESQISQLEFNQIQSNIEFY